MSSTLLSSMKERGLSLEMLQYQRASSVVQGRISWFAWSYGWKLRVPLELHVDQGIRSCLLGEVRSFWRWEGPFRISRTSLQGE